MRPAALGLLVAACTGQDAPTTPPPPAWKGGSVQAVALEDGGVAVLDVAWRARTPVLSPDRIPAAATISLRRLDASGAVAWESVLVEGERAAAHALALMPDGGLVALVTRPGTPSTTGLIRVEPGGRIAPFQTMGDAIVVRPRTLHVDATGRLHVGGSTATPLHGTRQQPTPGALDGMAGFVARMTDTLEPEWVHMWEAEGDQAVADISGTGEILGFIGHSGPTGRRVTAPFLGRIAPDAPAPTPIPDLHDAQALLWTAEGPIIAGWAATGPGSAGLPGSTPLAPRIRALDEAGETRWETGGCCGTWAHRLDLQRTDDALFVGGRADAATLSLGALEAQGGAGVQAFVARLDPATGAVRSLAGLGKVGDTPLDLPNALLVGTARTACLVTAAGTPPLCPADPASPEGQPPR